MDKVYNFADPWSMWNSVNVGQNNEIDSRKTMISIDEQHMLH